MSIRTSVSFFLPALAFALASTTAQADDRQHAVAGALIGGAAGALIGHELRGRDGALVGGALGAATGVAVATSNRRDTDYRERPREVVADDDYYRRDEPSYVRERVVYREVPVVRERVVYREAPVVVYRPVPVAYAPVRQVITYVPARHDRGDRHEWKRWKHHDKWHRKHGHDHDD